MIASPTITAARCEASSGSGSGVASRHPSAHLASKNAFYLHISLPLPSSSALIDRRIFQVFRPATAAELHKGVLGSWSCLSVVERE
jgi:hypothetical protein